MGSLPPCRWPDTGQVPISPLPGRAVPAPRPRRYEWRHLCRAKSTPQGGGFRRLSSASQEPRGWRLLFPGACVCECVCVCPHRTRLATSPCLTSRPVPPRPPPAPRRQLPALPCPSPCCRPPAGHGSGFMALPQSELDWSKQVARKCAECVLGLRLSANSHCTLRLLLALTRHVRARRRSLAGYLACALVATSRGSATSHSRSFARL